MDKEKKNSISILPFDLSSDDTLHGSIYFPPKQLDVSIFPLHSHDSLFSLSSLNLSIFLTVTELLSFSLFLSQQFLFISLFLQEKRNKKLDIATQFFSRQFQQELKVISWVFFFFQERVIFCNENWVDNIYLWSNNPNLFIVSC